MPDDLALLNKAQVRSIKEKISQKGVETPELLEDLLDHFCVAIEEEMKGGGSFDSAFAHVFDSLQEDELKTTEMKTQELLEDKKIFYPDFRQSLGLMIMIVGLVILWSVGVMIVLGVLTAVGIIEGGGEAHRNLFMEQYYPLIITLSNLLVFGAVIAYAIREIRQTQISAPVFSFRAVPAYVYGIGVLIAVLSQFWLDPVAMISILPEEAMADHMEKIKNASPVLMILAACVNIILFELLFRGIILKGLLMTTTPLKAILWSSFFCACVGFQLPLFFFLISLIQGWVYWKTRSLYPTILLFITGTIFSYGASLLIGNPAESNFSWWQYVGHNLAIYLPLVIGSFLLTLGLFYYLHKRLSVVTSSSER
ncbi:membrane protease YdiL (CAAX protease family) [Catalinimonas alkaloidigena]|uniref:CPBP family intramembrane glutamic endopeptidase n=1 Tax=Catalinimonas alkaloidigena TaxID=1075417 RepID=UPI0024049F5B|nr:type II CAAX endopeptidase family protein [Catalinimonas alkaloidigena]MDF9800494.1 membrane protease YdiL (CAAX protease family) [Catalinimonas alkaloidigena]